jgi:hypothetical protein
VNFMPSIQMGNSEYLQGVSLQSADYSYTYPGDRNWRPGSALHEKVKTRLIQYATDSSRVVKNRFESWRRIDQVLTAYIPLDDAEKALQSEDSRRPVSIVFPYSYAMMETLLTYLVMSFLQDPIIRYEGMDDKDTLGAILMEMVVQQQLQRTKAELTLHTFFRDALSYGVSYAATDWIVQKGKRTRPSGGSGLLDSSGRPVGSDRYTETAVVFEGTELTNIDPYRAFPDPFVPAHQVQKGTFFGWLRDTNLETLKTEEAADPDMFNVKYLNHLKGKRSQFAVDNSDRGAKTGEPGKFSETLQSKMSAMDVVYMNVNLVPEEWGLGSGTLPEKWVFALAQDEVIIMAQPLGYDHDQFPVISAAPDFDGYSAMPLSRLEMLYGLQGVLDFLFNSHMANVRKAINDMIIYDPYLVNGQDLKDPKPGKLIRMRRPAWGRGVSDSVMQLKVEDITRANMGDSSFIVQWMQLVSGADESMMGGLRSGGPERLTKSEFQGTRSSAISRLERISRVIGVQAIQDLGRQCAYNVQQLMTRDTFVKVAGDRQAQLVEEFGLQPGSKRKVTPFDLMIDYDITPRDGSVPGGNFQEGWLQLFNIIMSNQELAGQFDLVRIFKHIARNMGAKNVDDFARRAQPKLMPDEKVLDQVKAGNMIPAEVAGGQAQ